MSGQAHTGHMGSSGLQNHSVGDIYPWSVMGVGDSCRAIHLITGQVGERHYYLPGVAGSHGIAYNLAMEDVRDFQIAEQRKAA